MSDSPVIRLLETVWHSTAKGSWQRLNSSMSTALYLAIRAGFRFGLDDFSTISNRYRWGYWCGDGEGFYSAACGKDPNVSAARAYESFRARPAFILNGARLGIGDMLRWGDGADGWKDGEAAKITSFTGDSFVACTYAEPGAYNEKPKRRFTVSRKALKAAEKRAKEQGRKIWSIR